MMNPTSASPTTAARTGKRAGSSQLVTHFPNTQTHQRASTSTTGSQAPVGDWFSYGPRDSGRSRDGGAIIRNSSAKNTECIPNQGTQGQAPG